MLLSRTGLRVILNILLLIGILFAPWWLSVIFALALLIAFQAYEVPLWGLYADILHGAALPGYLHIGFVITLLFLLLFILIEYSKRHLMLYTG